MDISEQDYQKAVAVVMDCSSGSVSNLQRKLYWGYARAAAAIDRMQEEFIVSPMSASGRRDVYPSDIHQLWKDLNASKAQAVPEGFGLFDGDTLTYSNGYSINCSFDDEFDCHIFDVSKDGCYIKTGMTQLEQAHCLVLSMIKLDAKDSTLEAQEPANDQ